VTKELAGKMALNGLKEGILSSSRVALPVVYNHLFDKFKGKKITLSEMN
jgi:hypothetical protein